MSQKLCQKIKSCFRFLKVNQQFVYQFPFHIFLQYMIKTKMEKNLQMSVENCYLSFYENGQLHPCKLFFFENNLLKIQKHTGVSMEPLPKKHTHIVQDSMGFSLQINLSLKYSVSLRKITLPNLQLQKIEIIIQNKDSDEQLRLYVTKSSQNYFKLYNFFKCTSFIKRFDQFFQIKQLLKYPSPKQKAQFFLVQQKLSLKDKMVKKISKEGLQLSSWNSILKEIEIQNKSNSEGIIKFQSFFQDSDFVYLVYNQVSSKNLKQFVKQYNTGSKSYVKTILKQLLQAALELQINGIVHNNIQPSTISLIKDNQNWRCALNHFGDALLLNQCTSDIQNQINYHYGYSAPQIMKSSLGRISSKSDVFSIGIVFYFMVFDRELYRSQDNSKLYSDTYPEIDFSSQQAQSLPFQTLELLQRMLEFNPDKRISIIEALTHRYFTTRQHPLNSSLTKSITRESSIKKSSVSRSRSKTPKKGHHQSLLHSQPLNKINLQLQKQNTNPLYETTQGTYKQEKIIPTRFAHLRKLKKSFGKRTEEEGQIDSEQIDDSHISLEPRNSNMMTPSYELKKTNEFKFFTC